MLQILAGRSFQPKSSINSSSILIGVLVLLFAMNAAVLASVTVQPKNGDPLNGLTANQLNRFLVGKDDFNMTFTAETGLGPVFNKESCGNCHNNPIGGSGSQTVLRAGIPPGKGGVPPFDPLTDYGGSLFQKESIDPLCDEVVPNLPGVFETERSTPSALGFGLVEAIPDADIQFNADNPPAGISGRVHMVQPLEGPPGLRVGRFGWKAQVATVLTFSGDAALNEMGITNRLVPDENDPNGIFAPTLGECDSIADPEDDGPVGDAFIDHVTDFQRFLAPPPQTPKSGMTGEGIFASIGCTDCHIATFTTADDPGLEDAIRNKELHPYSDFLLHEMGTLFDGIFQGDAEGGEIRTPPIWGIRTKDPMLHNASVAGDTFPNRVTAAIVAHGGVGSEAKPSVDAFLALTPGERDSVIAFLDSLGRAEFDHDGDNDVDGLDFAEFLACFNGAQGYTPDDSCAISDINQDSAVDCTDYKGFLQAWNGSGEPPELEECALLVPTVSQWGMGTLALLLIVSVAIATHRRQRETTA